MRRTIWIRSLGIALVASVALSIGDRPTIRASQPSAIVSTATIGGAFGGAENDRLASLPVVHLSEKPISAEAAKVWLKLQEKVPMQFPNDTPIDDVLKYVQSSTVDKASLPEGIPIYLDPTSLERPKGPGPMITIDLKGIPLATTLKLALDQHGLVYRVHPDGFLHITSKDSEDAPLDADALILDNLSALREEVRQLRVELNHLHQADHPPTSPPAAAPGGMGSKGGMM